MKRIFVLAALVTVAFAAAGAACSPAKTQTETTPAPDFAIKDLQGASLSLASYKGKVLVLNFWATWCPPCRREIPDFIETYRGYKDKGLEILGVSVDETTAPALRSREGPGSEMETIHIESLRQQRLPEC